MMNAGPEWWRSDQVQAVASVRETDVAEDDVGRFLLDERARRGDVARGANDRDAAGSLEECRQAIGDRRVILDDGHADHVPARVLGRLARVRRPAIGRCTVIVVPRPDRDVTWISPPWAVTISLAT